MNSSLKKRILALPISAIADALDGYGVIDTSIMPLENDWILCGTARTVWTLPGTDSWANDDFLSSIQHGDVIVVDSGDNMFLSCLTAQTAQALQTAGAVGVVMNGYAFQKPGEAFPLFCRGTHPCMRNLDGKSHQGVPISVGGAAILEGDLIYGSRDGVVCIRADQGESVVARAEFLQINRNTSLTD